MLHTRAVSIFLTDEENTYNEKQTTLDVYARNSYQFEIN